MGSATSIVRVVGVVSLEGDWLSLSSHVHTALTPLRLEPSKRIPSSTHDYMYNRRDFGRGGRNIEGVVCHAQGLVQYSFCRWQEPRNEATNTYTILMCKGVGGEVPEQ